MNRAVSTVVDATVFLLFAGAAVAVILSGTVAEAPRVGNPAAADAELLATSTATVEYELSTSAVRPNASAPSWVANATARRQRSAHGTVAELLGDATLSGVEVDDKRISRARTGFEREITATTRRRLQHRERLTAVRARWEPYPGAPVAGTVHVGDPPPGDTDVRAATVTVPSGMDNATGPALAAARSSGYDGVATVLARTVVEGLFPPDRTALALRGDYPADAVMAARYIRMANYTGAAPLALARSDPASLNRNLTAALADRFRADLRSRFASPTAAAQVAETHRVRITVRTWSP
jgi:hypothetical protein